MNGRIGSAVILASSIVAACGSSPPPAVEGDDAVATCPVGQLSEPEILAVKRDPPDRPLADLSHYAARQAPRAADAQLNGGGCQDNTRFRYGAGIGDITGPALDQEMLGYADPAQVAMGLHTRQHARAFAFSSACGNREGYAMLITIENALAFDSIKFGLMERIAADTEHRLADYWNMDNVVLSATHTHSSAGGQAHYDLANVFAFGFDEQSYAAAVDGVYEALLRAHRNLMSATPGPIRMAQAELLDANFNRSPLPYGANPDDERARFLDEGGREVDTNRMMTLLKLQRDDGTDVGMLNWFSVHPTSIGQTHRLLSSDNKGFAAARFEQDFAEGVYAEGAFVAGFFQSDEGDVTPNPFMDALSEAELRGRDSEAWFTRGGGRDDYESAMISGYKQYRHARDLWDAAETPLHGEVAAIHLPMLMADAAVETPLHYDEALMPAIGDPRTCEPALGISFAGGAEDGRGPFTEGAACPMSDDELLPFLGSYLEDTLAPLLYGGLPSTLIEPIGCYNPAFSILGYACHMEKPIAIPLTLAPAGLPLLEMQPRIVPLQIVTLGNLAIVALPWETTTMAGRRVRDAALDALQDAGVDYAVIAGLSNTYIHYLTTREEYELQHYEGASNVFGPWTLDVVTQEITRLARQLRNDEPPSSPYAADHYSDHQPLLFTHLLLAVADSPLPDGAAYGDVTQQPEAEYDLGAADRVTVSARFYTAHPRNDLLTGGSYVYVDRQVGEDWQVVARDDDWSTQFRYLRNGVGDEAQIDWQIPAGTAPGTYRLRYEGVSEDGAYSGASRSFELKHCE